MQDPSILIQLLNLEVQRLQPTVRLEVSLVEAVGLLVVVLQLNRAETRVLIGLNVVAGGNVNAFPRRLKAEVSNNVMKGIIPIYQRPTIWVYFLVCVYRFCCWS